MTAPLSQDLRKRLVRAVDEGAAARGAAARIEVSVMDNLAAHKVTGVREAITAAGASTLYLPPYSPDPNPIEQMFAKLKALLRKASARTRDAQWNTIGRLLDEFSPTKCRNYLQKAEKSGPSHSGP